jgi:hypothetical protein
MRRRGLSHDQVDEAIHLYNLGWSLARVGEHLNVDHTTVLTKLGPVSQVDLGLR